MKKTLLFLCFALCVGNILAQGQSDAEAIAQKAYKTFKCLGEDRINSAVMEIKDGDGQTTMTRELVVMRKNIEGSDQQKWYAYFKKPSDIKKMVFMVWINPGKDDDRWLYLPSMDLVKRLVGSDKRSSFAGSQFVYEDITGRHPSSDTHELIETTDKYYVVKSTPKDKGVEFSSFTSYINKESFFPEKRIFVDKQGNPQREYKAITIENIDGFPTATSFSMTNLSTNESTLTSYSKVRYNQGIPEKIFKESSLRRTPRKWLK